MLSPAGLFAPCGGGTPFRRKVTSDHRPQHFFPLDAPTFRWMVSERGGSPLQYQCQYILLASLLYIFCRLLTVFFFIEMLAVWRHVIPAGRSRPAFAALAPADHAPANQRVLADEHQSPGATGRRNFPSTQTLW